MRLLWIPHASWETPQRAHLFCSHLARRHEVFATDWGADWTSSQLKSGRAFRQFGGGSYLQAGVRIFRVPRFPGGLVWPALRRVNAALYSRVVTRLIRQARIDVVVGCFVCPPPRAPRLVLDICDNHPAYWREYRHAPGYAEEIERSETRWIEAADAIVCSSYLLAERARFGAADRANVQVVPNGVDVTRFRAGDGAPVRVRHGLQGKCVVGIVGLFGEFSGLLELIAARGLIEDDTVELLVVGDGALLEPAKRLAEARGIRGVTFVGKVPYEDVPAHVAAMDVAVMPNAKSDFTEIALPIKIVEYAAARKRIVSTDVAELRHHAFEGMVLVEPTPEGFARGITEAREMEPPTGMSGVAEQYDAERLVRRYEVVLTSSPTVN